MRAIFETLFDIFYLLTVLSVGQLFLRRAKISKIFLLFPLTECCVPSILNKVHFEVIA